MSKPFRFKHFEIKQDHCAMKVGTDGVLIGAWADCENAKNILDIGAGTGIIALMMAQRSSALVDTVEMDEDSFKEAQENIKNSNWAGRLNIYHNTFQEFAKKQNKKYQLIISNPPFFSGSLKAATSSRTNARHNDSLPTIDLFEGVEKLLTSDGKFCVIIPADSVTKFTNIAKTYHLNCSNKLIIKPTPTKDAKRALLEFSYSKESKHEPSIIIEDKGRHGYSDDFRLLTKDFYLSF